MTTFSCLRRLSWILDAILERNAPKIFSQLKHSNILEKILDHIIIVKQSDALTTSQHQYGFKANSSTVLCSTIVIETVQYYTGNGARPVYVIILRITS